MNCRHFLLQVQAHQLLLARITLALHIVACLLATRHALQLCRCYSLLLHLLSKFVRAALRFVARLLASERALDCERSTVHCIRLDALLIYPLLFNALLLNAHTLRLGIHFVGVQLAAVRHLLACLLPTIRVLDVARSVRLLTVLLTVLVVVCAALASAVHALHRGGRRVLLALLGEGNLRLLAAIESLCYCVLMFSDSVHLLYRRLRHSALGHLQLRLASPYYSLHRYRTLHPLVFNTLLLHPLLFNTLLLNAHTLRLGIHFVGVQLAAVRHLLACLLPTIRVLDVARSVRLLTVLLTVLVVVCAALASAVHALHRGGRCGLFALLGKGCPCSFAAVERLDPACAVLLPVLIHLRLHPQEGGRVPGPTTMDSLDTPGCFLPLALLIFGSSSLSRSFISLLLRLLCLGGSSCRKCHRLLSLFLSSILRPLCRLGKPRLFSGLRRLALIVHPFLFQCTRLFCRRFPSILRCLFLRSLLLRRKPHRDLSFRIQQPTDIFTGHP